MHVCICVRNDREREREREREYTTLRNTLILSKVDDDYIMMNQHNAWGKGSRPICHDGGMNGGSYLIHSIQYKGHHHYKIANLAYLL
mgnify:CR=1 FL=1